MLSRMYGDWVIMLAAAAIAARITRLATKDTLTAPIREWADQRGQPTPDPADDEETDETPEPEKSHLAVFLGCTYCIGWWITIATFLIAYLIWPGHDWSAPQLLVWAGAASITNLVHGAIASTTSTATEHIEHIRRTGKNLAQAVELSILRRRS